MVGWLDGWMEWPGSGGQDGGEVDEEEEIRGEVDGMGVDLDPLPTLVQPLQLHRPRSSQLGRADPALGPVLVLELADGLGPLAVLSVGRAEGKGVCRRS
jgi:hypothetical protein